MGPEAVAQQAGGVDPTFGASLGLAGRVEGLVLQKDGKLIVIGGERGIVRLNADGSLDAAFDPRVGVGTDGVIRTVVVQPDGKIIVVGDFTTFNGVAYHGIVRLNAEGRLDPAFDPGAGANRADPNTFGSVHTAVVQPDGKIVCGGNFDTFNGAARNGVARLNADGSLDTTFNPGSGVRSIVYAVAVQPDGRIVIVGGFTTFNGVARNGVARLNADGSLDGSLQADLNFGPNGTVIVAAVQPDGRIVIVGGFTTFNGVARNGVARLNADGSLDTAFDPGAGVNHTGKSKTQWCSPMTGSSLSASSPPSTVWRATASRA